MVFRGEGGGDFAYVFQCGEWYLRKSFRFIYSIVNCESGEIPGVFTV